MTLTVDDVVFAGVQLAQRDGVDAVGVRGVAAELGVTPMALYRHVANAVSLHSAVVERLLEALPRAERTGDWQHDSRGWARRSRSVLGAAPGLGDYVLVNWTRLPAALGAVDSLCALFAEIGPPGVDVVAAANAVFTYVLTRVQAEQAVRRAGLERDLEILRARRHEFPTLWANRRDYAVARLDKHFAYGLDVILRGLP